MRLPGWLCRDRGVRSGGGRLDWLRVARAVAALVVIGASVYYLARVAGQSGEHLEWGALRLEAGPLAISLGLTVFCVGLGGWAWQLILAGLGYALSLDACLAIQTTSNLAKYVPGYAWQVLGKAYLTRRADVPTRSVALALALEFGGLLLTGLLVALAFMPAHASLPGLGRLPVGWRAALGATLLAILLILPRLLRIWRARATRPGAQCAIGVGARPTRVWGGLAVMLVAWVLFGVAFGQIIGTLHPASRGEWPLSIYSLTVSFVVSLLAVFVPGGIGLREGIMTYVLSVRLPTGVALAAAVLSRLILVLSELIAFGAVRAWHAVQGRCKRSITPKG